ncbi:MAG: methionyl-tRNA formyltransferase [Clostridia bacterium]|nr:methionyl-tRNA formyltransferase [Clostridia bacterium]
MRILFMGTPDFASEILRAIAGTQNEIVGVVSQPDKPKGRGHKFVPTDVKVTAESLGLTVYQPETLKDGAFEGILDNLKPDMIVVAAYGKILPEYILNYPEYGCVNVHASLLPKYRGAAPIQWSIINGDEETGVCIMKMEKGLDTGDIISVEKTPIGEYETAGELFDRLAKLGGKLLVRTIAEMENSTAILCTKQDGSQSTYAEKITKETAKIDWSQSCEKISKLICGMSPFPGAYTTYKNEMVKIYEAVKTNGEGKNGEILGIEKNKGLKVACGSGALYIKTVQFPGLKRMNVEDYARGHEIENGIVLGDE